MKRIMRCVLVISLPLALNSYACAQDITVFGYTPSISQTTPLGERLNWGTFIGTTINPRDLHFDTLDYPASDIRFQFSNTAIFKLRQDITLSMGVFYQRNFPFDDRHVTELRPFEQITVSHKIGRSSVNHRLRFSERFMQNKITGEFPLTTMLQYMTSFQHSLGGNRTRKQWYVAGYAEEYITISGANKYATFSEFWAYLGIGCDLGKMGRIQNGIVYEWVIRNSHRNVRHLAYLETVWITNFDLFKKLKKL